MNSKFVLEVNQVKKFFPIKNNLFLPAKQFVKAVNDVSLNIGVSETVGLVGESGSGKSTLGKLILSLFKIDSGSIFIDQQDISDLSFKKLQVFRRKVQMIFQDPMDCLNPRFTSEQLIQEPLDIHQWKTLKERKERVKELFQQVGLHLEWLQRYPHQFSGGQRQRIGIARALALQPQLIIADEPVSALDVSVQAQILNLLQSLQDKTKVSYLFISHDLNVIRHISDRILVMYLGKIVEEAKQEDLYQNPLHPYTKQLLASVPIPDPTKKQVLQEIKGEIPSLISLPKGCSFHPRCALATEKCKESSPTLKPLSDNSTHKVSCHLVTG